MKSVCVYCGANPGSLPVYREAAVQLGEVLAREGIRMIYGGGNVGLMGITADAALAAGGTVIGIIPEALERKEVAHRKLSELHVVRSMHERKMMMAELADGFVALPGGIGTAEEILESFTWSQLGIHLKPCGLLNVDGFYGGFLAQLERMVEDQFLRSEQLSQLLVAENASNLIRGLRAVKPVVINKWVEKDRPGI